MKEGNCFFKLMQAALQEESVAFEKDAFSEETLAKLYQLSKFHDLAHLVGHALDKYGLFPENSESKKKFMRERNMAVFRFEQIDYELKEICRILEENKIKHIPLKGAVGWKYYPEPWMRTRCDIDILIPKQEVERAVTILVEQGLRYDEATTEHDVQLWTQSGVHLELHYDLIEKNVAPKSAAVLSKVWEHAIPCENCEYCLQLSDAFFYFYHVAHMAKHFLNGGCGIRPFLDLWMFSKQEAFQGEEKDVLLKEADLFTFVSHAQQLIKVWFFQEPYDDLTHKIEDYIVWSGIYGTLDNHIALKQLKIGSKKKHLLSRIFLPYAILKKTYPILEKHKILYPFYQVRRWFRILFGKNKKHAILELKAIANTKEDKKERLSALCKQMGLTK